MKTVAVIMAGGTGTRFWPLSREHRPKQLLSIGNHPVMLDATIDRLRESVPVERILVVTSRNHATLIDERIDVLPERNIIVEPEGRDTAAASGLAAVVVDERFGDDTVIGTFPADHRISPTEDFRRFTDAAYRGAAELDAIVTFGVEPTHPATGYGYIIPRTETHTVDERRLKRVDQFTEKPDRQQAMDYIEEDNALWNSGMFFWPVDRILKEFQDHAPDLRRGLETIRTAWNESGSLDDALISHYGDLPETSVDYAILERTNRCWTLPVDFNWNDLGTWDSVADLIEADNRGNVTHGDVVALNAENNILYEDGDTTIGVVGTNETVVVATEDAVLVCPKERTQDVKSLVQALRDRGREDLL